MRLVQSAATQPELQSRLRETLNMSRDVDKWRKLQRMLQERVSSRLEPWFVWQHTCNTIPRWQGIYLGYCSREHIGWHAHGKTS